MKLMLFVAFYWILFHVFMFHEISCKSMQIFRCREMHRIFKRCNRNTTRRFTSLCLLSLFSRFKTLSPTKQRIAIKDTDARKSMCICFNVGLVV